MLNTSADSGAPGRQQVPVPAQGVGQSVGEPQLWRWDPTAQNRVVLQASKPIWVLREKESQDWAGHCWRDPMGNSPTPPHLGMETEDL